MKKILLIVSCCILLVSAAQAQALDKNAFSAKVLFLDYGRPNSIDNLDITNGLELAYVRNINRWLNVAVPLKVGVVNVPDDINNRTFGSIDGLLQLQYAKADSSRLIPYLLGGAGVVMEEELGANIQFPVGAGMNIRVGGRSYVNLQGEYRIAQEENRNNLQLGLGYLHRFGKLDADGDGIVDSLDDCPNEAGSAATNGCPDRDMDGIADREDQCPLQPGKKRFNGCPDTDGDEVIDSMDDCPEIAGIKKLKGCPDADGDGIADKDDDCPDVKGVASAKGCPDADGDGVADARDKCPNEPGRPEYSGCPYSDRDADGVPDEQDDCPEEAGSAATAGCPDGDGDGVADKLDKCPTVAGPYEGCPDTDGDGLHDGVDACPEQAGIVENKGCPELKKEEKEVLNLAMRAVQFETGKATLKPESNQVLGQIVQIMGRYPGYKLRISGHTDNTGEESSNQVLSEERAKACYQYLIAQGVEPSRISYQGFGESRPIATNLSASGRSLNRRVEFDLYIE
ncbi:MAG: thrombospondin type 3 repeat-containing protein [Phaeodactylibacter sp.]|nr:thrombospondin type 3 repeat-containing protein [Phaeodactylibacter sp.]MCB9300862.1 thrombospondin type 3 repeat-containing protein [Lewinellaceae bacterium]